ncbi:MAG: Bax inhibitor-1/YccA family protein [Myxococcales bacterium]|nr:MAG: Bax inhibitor-1/YccA family protein [Myxococcales bacterium]
MVSRSSDTREKAFMNQSTHQSFVPGASGALEGSRASFLRKVYLLMTAATGVAGATAAATTLLGADQGVAMRGGVMVPPAIAWSMGHPWLTFGLLMAGTFGAGAVMRRPGVNLLALFGLSGLLGFVAAPAIWYAQYSASQGTALNSSPVLSAFGLAVAGFAGLSAYAIVSKRDFSNLGGFLTMGLFVVIAAGLLNFFLASSVLSLALASVTILLFGGYTLYDTSRMLRDGETDPVPAALSQFLNLFNLFMALLRIFSGGRRD